MAGIASSKDQQVLRLFPATFGFPKLYVLNTERHPRASANPTGRQSKGPSIKVRLPNGVPKYATVILERVRHRREALHHLPRQTGVLRHGETWRGRPYRFRNVWFRRRRNPLRGPAAACRLGGGRAVGQRKHGRRPGCLGPRSNHQGLDQGRAFTVSRYRACSLFGKTLPPQERGTRSDHTASLLSLSAK